MKFVQGFWLFCSKYKWLFGPWFLIGDSGWILSKMFNVFNMYSYISIFIYEVYF